MAQAALKPSGIPRPPREWIVTIEALPLPNSPKAM